ncbi:hypothetical protein SAMN02745121_07318, partial [Nannocystis exedens]
MRKYLRHFTHLTLTLSALMACDSGDITPRKGEPTLVCGGFAGLECPGDLVCVDDPNDDCNPYKDGADCIGYCEDPGPTACGGFPGTPCPEGQVCVD